MCACVCVCRTFSRKFRMIAFPRIIICFTPYLFGFMFCVFSIRFAHLRISSICSLPLSHRVYRTLTTPHFWLSLHFQHLSLCPVSVPDSGSIFISTSVDTPITPFCCINMFVSISTLTALCRIFLG